MSKSNRRLKRVTQDTQTCSLMTGPAKDREEKFVGDLRRYHGDTSLPLDILVGEGLANA